MTSVYQYLSEHAENLVKQYCFQKSSNDLTNNLLISENKSAC